MIDENYIYINKVSIDEIPWHRLTTPYGRADNFPDLFKNICNNNIDSVGELTNLIEHQSTLWHCTPFAIIFLCRFLKDAFIKNDVKIQILHALYLVAMAVNEMSEEFILNDDDQLKIISDMLLEKYLWSDVYDAEEDYIRYEEGPFADELFCSFWYFSLEVLKLNQDVFVELSNNPESKIKDLATKIKNLLQ